MKLNQRLATINDARLYWYWVNEQEMQAMSFTMKQISWEEHIRWFVAGLKDSSKRIMLIYENDAGVPIGQVRLVSVNGERRLCEWGISVDKTERGKGYGRTMTEMSFAHVFNVLKYKKLIAQTKETNIGCRKLLERIGCVQGPRILVQLPFNCYFHSRIIFAYYNYTVEKAQYEIATA